MSRESGVMLPNVTKTPHKGASEVNVRRDSRLRHPPADGSVLPPSGPFERSRTADHGYDRVCRGGAVYLAQVDDTHRNRMGRRRPPARAAMHDQPVRALGAERRQAGDELP
jgi:hypothetical protein